MKIGKPNWDQTFLDLLEFANRHEFIDALKPYYQAINSERHAWNDLSDDYEEAIKTVKHLENRSNLTEDEFHQWEGTVGWYENAGEEIGFREESLATGLIIAVWKMVNHFAKTAAKGAEKRGHPEIKGKFDCFRIGPLVSGQPWALALNAASNYVRHADDWGELRKYTFANGASGKWDDDIPENTRQLKQTKQNLKILESIGLEVPYLLSNNDMAYTVAEKLSLLEQSSMERFFWSWTGDVKASIRPVLNL